MNLLQQACKIICGKKSYHIAQKMDSHYFYIWPSSGFGRCITNPLIARLAFHNIVMTSPNNKYRLIRHDLLSKKAGVIMVTGESKIIKEDSVFANIGKKNINVACIVILIIFFCILKTHTKIK